MANAKKMARQQRALERLEARIEIDGLGFAKSANNSRNTWSQEREHYKLRDRLGLIPRIEPRWHPSDPRANPRYR